MTAWLLPLAVGFATGILSAWGVGGGTLLLLCMTLLLGVDQRTAQTINLLYFLPTAGMGLLSHGKGGLLEKPVLRSVPSCARRSTLISTMSGSWWKRKRTRKIVSRSSAISKGGIRAPVRCKSVPGALYL